MMQELYVTGLLGADTFSLRHDDQENTSSSRTKDSVLARNDDELWERERAPKIASSRLNG